MSSALVSLLAVGAGLGTYLHMGSEMAVVPVEAGCSFVWGGELLLLRLFLELIRGVLYLEGDVL
jgi:hypothetical protein